jgi:hypothetical protein
LRSDLNDRSKSVDIDPGLYFLSKPTLAEAALPPKYFTEQRAFIDKYGAVEGALRIHVDDPNDGNPRHHAFYVHVESLLQSEAFRAEFRAKLQVLEPRPTLIFAPQHAAAERLAIEARDALAVEAFVHPNFRLSADSGERIPRGARHDGEGEQGRRSRKTDRFWQLP